MLSLTRVIFSTIRFVTKGKLQNYLTLTHILSIYRLNCQDSCNKAYFPSLFCEKIEDVEIQLNGNVFNNFYKYPDPEYVINHESAVESQIPNQPNYLSKMSMIADSTRSMIKSDYDQCSSYSDQILEYETVRDGT